MACATLKRTHEYENANTHPKKKRRCNFLGTFERDATTHRLEGDDNSGAEILNQHQMQHDRSISKSANVISLSPSKLREDIFQQTQFIRKVKQCNALIAGCEHMQVGNELSGLESPQQLSHSNNHQQQQQNEDKAVFTFKQVQQICERMLKEKDVEVRAEYDSMLANKLAEQYDQFVKFTFDQIQNNYKGTPSYLT